MLDLHRPLVYHHDAAATGVGVSENPTAPKGGGIGRQRKRGCATRGLGEAPAWTLLGHSDGYRLMERDLLPSQFSALFQPGANGWNPAPGAFGEAVMLDLASPVAL